MNAKHLVPIALCIGGILTSSCAESVDFEPPSETQSQPLSSHIRYPAAGEGINLGEATRLGNQGAAWALEDSLNAGQSVNSGSKKFSVRQLSPQEINTDAANKEPQ